MPAPTYPKIGSFKNRDALVNHLDSLGLTLPVDEQILSADAGSPLGQPMTFARQNKTESKMTVGNRWCIHPMEGWDAQADGKPSEYTHRRWQRFGVSGAKLIWGGEAFAVQADGKANPMQLCYHKDNVSAMADLLTTLKEAHRQRFGVDACDDLCVGLQLTHSGRFSRPHDKARLEPRIAYHHPLLDKKFGIDPDDDATVITDDEIKKLIDSYIVSAKMAYQIGFDFVDVKHCHGYLGHELLSAYDRPGPFGGDLESRSRFMRLIIEGIGAACPGLRIGVRLSVFDRPAYHPDKHADQAKTGQLGPGVPDDFDAAKGFAVTESTGHPGEHPGEGSPGGYPGFGCCRERPLEIDLDEPIQLLKKMRDAWQVAMVNITAGSPYYNPHIQRPAYFPPSDGYLPPEDPLVGCVRQIQVVRQLKQAVPGLPLVGSAYTYFQQWLPHVAQAVVRDQWTDFVGVGRMVLSYADMPADCLALGELRHPKLICRTFSDCTTGPRNGIISGCYPLDDFYKNLPEHQQLKDAKKALRERLKVVG